MKRLLTVLMTLVFGMVAVYAKPTLDGNKILLDEAATSKFSAEQFIANVGGEDSLDTPDEIGNTKRMQLELLCNPNKVIEFATEEMAIELYNQIMSIKWNPEDFYVQETDHYENLDFWLFMTFFRIGSFTYEKRDGKKVITGYNPKTTATYCYVEEW